MYKKLGLLLIVVVGLTALFTYLWIPEKVEPTRFIDRLPEADIIGKADLLELVTEIMPALYYYQIPAREFISPDFILSQGKAYGIEFQKPLYFFGTEDEDTIKDWGALIPVDDSSKVLDGILTLAGLFDVHDSTIFEKKVFVSNSLHLAVTYGKDWILIGSPKKFGTYLDHVLHAKLNSISSRWKEFLADETFGERALVIRAISPRLKENGIASLLLATTNDSSSLTLHAKISQFDSLSFKLKPQGPTFDEEDYTNRTINAHFDIDKLRGNTRDPLYRLLASAGKKVSFPIDRFLDAWDGDVAYRQGGLQNISEKYIVSELDEDFNITEVVKYKQIKVSGFSLYLSMNENKDAFLTDVFDKGILTSEGNKFRLLYFPPMRMKVSDTSVLFHTSRYAPAAFQMDSAKVKSVYGKVTIPLKKILQDYLPQP
jgi:hypothetical protein